MVIDPENCNCLLVTPTVNCTFDFFTVEGPPRPCGIQENAFAQTTCEDPSFFNFGFLNNCINESNTFPLSVNYSACNQLEPFSICVDSAAIVNVTSQLLLGHDGACTQCPIPFSWTCCNTGNTGTGTGNSGQSPVVNDEDDDNDDDDNDICVCLETNNSEPLGEENGPSPVEIDNNTWWIVVIVLSAWVCCICIFVAFAAMPRGEDDTGYMGQPLMSQDFGGPEVDISTDAEAAPRGYRRAMYRG